MASSRTEPEVLDLVDIALLLHYGMFTTDPRLRGAKLLEVAYPGEKLTTAKPMRSDFLPKDGRSQTTILFEIPSTQTPAGSANEPDLPSNMVPPESLTFNPKLNLLTPKQFETLFYQARGFNGCFTAAVLLQNFFDLIPQSTTKLHIRHGPLPGGAKSSSGFSYTTTLDTFRIVEKTFVGPQFCTTIMVHPTGRVHVSGDESTIIHAVVAFTQPGTGSLTSFLDLSSLQFGDVGRGLGGSGLFALETLDEFNTRMGKISKGVLEDETQISHRIRANPDTEDWLTLVAQQAKARWDKRDKEKWCGHCGAPVSTAKTCSGCMKAWYCGQEHQRMAWRLHKYYCVKK